MFQLLAIGPCKRDWGRNIMHCCCLCLQNIAFKSGANCKMCNSISWTAALKEKEVEKEEKEEETGLQVHFDNSCVDTATGRIKAELSFIASLRLWLLSIPSSHYNAVFYHILHFLIKELIFIHSVIDRSSIVFVQIPLKTARFRSFSSFPAEFICLPAACPLI